MLTRLILALCATLALTLAAPAQEGSSDDADVSDPTGSVSVAPVARDEQIDDRILEILTATGWYDAPQVSTRDGIVFLDGQAATEEHKTWARNLATNTQDVVAVVNRIEVVPEVNWSFAPALQAIKDVVVQVTTSLPLIVLAIVILPFAWWLSSWVAGLLRRWLLGGMESPLLRDIFSRILALPIFLIGLYVVLQVAGLTQLAFSLLGGAGVIGIVAGFEGSVQSMNTRSTVLLSPEGNHIQIPNATIFKNTITNFTASPIRREVIDVGIGYDASVDFWIDARNYSVLKVKSAILRQVKKVLTEEGVSMPDDAREAEVETAAAKVTPPEGQTDLLAETTKPAE